MIKKLQLDLVVRFANLVLVVALPIFGWVGNMVFNTLRDHDIRITRMEEGHANRKELQQIWQAINLLPKEAPPRWFVDRVSKMENQLDDLAKATDANYRELISKLNDIKK